MYSNCFIASTGAPPPPRNAVQCRGSTKAHPTKVDGKPLIPDCYALLDRDIFATVLLGTSRHSAFLYGFLRLRVVIHRKVKSPRLF